ncbi:hypothetical protein D9615_003661 [Tricholomella constricta]|uniref:GAR domain-containing protein n=1 Tax=Tricholomella constricta TaxID=117010 RepID=A0A8H5HHZ6_9AGAR|nr:hypothetical protein D9615_003661 [Tricholomella constricta]
MVSTTISSHSSNISSSSQTNLTLPPSPSSLSGASASSSKLSLDQEDEENVTITRPLSKKAGKQRSQEDLRLLAISTHMTELSYAISDIQTRIFEIQELRHKSQSSGDSTSTTNVIDQSLMSLNDKLEAVEKGMKSINELLEPLLQVASTPTFQHNGDPNDNALMLRKHATLQAEWEAIQNESEVLREELKEDKWLTVFRTVTDQADGMMSSLEKAVNRCQDFIWQVHRRGGDDPRQSQTSLSAVQRNEKPQPLTLEVCASLLDSFEAKKKHYMPATSKVLSIIDKGVRDRVTKNGETLRRHAESAQRWKNLRERISRTGVEMENVRKILLNGEATPSENGSSTSGTMSTKNGYLATPPSGSRSSRAPSSASTLSRSISPFRKFARKITGTSRHAPVTPLSVNKKTGYRTPSSEPVQTIRRQKTSLFPSLRGSQPPTPITPDRPGHKYSQSLTPDSSPHTHRVDNATVKVRSVSNKQPWNSSTKVESDMTIRGTPPKRSPSAAGMYAHSGDIPPVPPIGTPYRRSLSRASMASSRPWSPVTSSISTTQSSQPNHFPIFRPPSRAQTPAAPARGVTPGLSATPRSRPKTPSHIPMPSKQMQITPSRSDNSMDDDNAHLYRALSPTLSVTSSGFGHPPRPPSRSMIPVPSLHLSSPSRPSSSMSDYTRTDTFGGSATRAQTPEHTLRARVQQMTFFHSTSGRSAARPSLNTNKLPPSSFRDSPASRTPSRPGSRAGAYTPTMDNLPMYEYIPGNPKDPLDVEVAEITNAIAHGLLIERVDPPIKKVPKEGEEVKAQYAFSNALSRKVVTCRLTTLTRPGKAGHTKKVMCRVGGGWQDLSHYILNRQAGM